MQTNLADLPPHAPATVLRLPGTSPVLRRLAELGLTPGASVVLLRRAPLGDPIQIRVRGSTLTVRLRDAKEVIVCEKSCSAATPTAARPR